MGFFGPAKIRTTPKEFVTTQLDSLFSPEFVGQQRSEHANLSKGITLLQKVSPDMYVIQKQDVAFNLLQLAWDRNVPYPVFIEYSSMFDDPRVTAVNSGVYDRCLSRAQEAGMDTFGFIATIFIYQLFPNDADKQHADIPNLYEIYGTEFTGLYLSYEAMVKRHKFVTSH